MSESAKMTINQDQNSTPNSSFHSWHGQHPNNQQDGPSSATPPTSFRRHLAGSAMSDTTGARGSMRKMLPATPSMETQMNLSAKMIDRRTSTPKGSHSYGPFFLEYSLLAEYNLLQKQRLPGIYVIPSANSPLCWFGIAFVRQGMYQEGIFRFKLIIPENYPDGDCPRLMFENDLFHPLVDSETFELDVRRGFPRWRRNVNHIWQVLFYTRRIFYKIDTTDPLNKEAAELFTNDVDKYRSRAQECVAQWKRRLYDAPTCDDPHYMKFSPFDESIHGDFLKKKNPMVSETTETKSLPFSSLETKGLSFLEPGSLKIFSKVPF